MNNGRRAGAERTTAVALETVTSAVTLLAMLAMLACSTDHQSKPAATDSARIPPSTDSDGILIHVRGRPPIPQQTNSQAIGWTEEDPTAGRLGILQDSIARFPDDPRAPNWLWETGTLMLQKFSYVSDSGPAAEFARQHPEQFYPDQSYERFVYSGYHLSELVRRFPTHELADDAGYRLTSSPTGGECEGYVPCYIEVGGAFTSLNAFLTQFPKSKYAGDAVSRANDAFAYSLSGGGYDTLDPKTVDSLITAYSSTAARLPDSLRSRAQVGIDTARHRLDRLARAERQSRSQP